MTISRIALIPVMAFAFSLGAGAAFAESPAHNAPISSNRIPTEVKPVEAMMPAQKSDISKACSAAADKQNLHGKARKKFRDACKSHGGPTT